MLFLATAQPSEWLEKLYAMIVYAIFTYIISVYGEIFHRLMEQGRLDELDHRYGLRPTLLE